MDKGLDAVGGGGDQRLTGVPGVVGGDAAPPGECTDCHSGEPPPTHWFTPQMPTNAGWGQAEAGNSGQAFQASAGPVPGPPPAASRVCTNRKLVRSRDWTRTQYRSERTGLATHRPGARCRSGTPPFTEETAAKTLFLNKTAPGNRAGLPASTAPGRARPHLKHGEGGPGAAAVMRCAFHPGGRARAGEGGAARSPPQGSCWGAQDTDESHGQLGLAGTV